MWFVDTDSLELREISESDIITANRAYAILSHTWTREEVLYQEMRQQKSQLQHKQGYAKLKGVCKIAKQLGHDLIWIDTCCINKDSTAELSEAIRSMYRWYTKATVCIVYLEDVVRLDEMANSRWFTRGWTLQELVAPTVVKFFSREWKSIGDKTALVNKLSNITRIPADVLRDPAKARQCSVAQRMSWAAGRATTRPEDIAYSLVGLFNVSLHTEYGEQEQAFIRLQEAIADKSSDESIFAWHMNDAKKDRKHSGLFATSPDEFERCGRYVSRNASEGYHRDNTGMKMSFLTLPYSMGTYTALLDVIDKDSGSRVAILLSKLEIEGRYTRVCNSKRIDLLHVPDSTQNYTRRSMTVHQDSIQVAKEMYPGFWLRKLEFPGHNAAQTKLLSHDNCKESDRLAVPEDAPDETRNIAGNVIISHAKRSFGPVWSQVRTMKFGFDDEFNPLCQLANRISEPEEEIAMSSEISPKNQDFIFGNQWTEKEGELLIWNHRWSAGFVFLRGDRDGLQYTLPAFNLTISIQCYPDRSPGGLVSGRSVWTVDVTEIKSGVGPE